MIRQAGEYLSSHRCIKITHRDRLTFDRAAHAKPDKRQDGAKEPVLWEEPGDDEY